MMSSGSMPFFESRTAQSMYGWFIVPVAYGLKVIASMYHLRPKSSVSTA